MLVTLGFVWGEAAATGGFSSGSPQWPAHELRLSLDGATPPLIEVGDFNDDGYPDLAACFDGPRWLENNPAHPSSWAEHTIATPFDFSHCQVRAIGDLNLDGTIDLVVSGSRPPRALVWHENTGRSEERWAPHIIFDTTPGELVGEMPHHIGLISIVDMDNDGLPDLLTGGGWYKNRGDTSPRFELKRFPEDLTAWVPSTHDIDGDGDIDVYYVIPCNTSEFGWAENIDGEGTVWTKHVIPTDSLECPYLADPHFGDENEVLVCGARQAVKFRNTNSDGIEWEPEPVDESVWRERCTDDALVADIDSDSMSDLILYDSEQKSLAWSPMDPLVPPALWRRFNIHTPVPTVIKVHAADFDQNGFVDVLVSANEWRQFTTLTWYRNPVGDCGDGVVQTTEQCDDGGISSSCDDDCSFAVCGDGFSNLAAGEMCDDGNTDPSDDCLLDCTLPFCGDAIVHAGVEECDDANRNEYDRCTSECQLRQMCGDANDDGKLSASDALLIMKRAIDLPVICPDWICDTDATSPILATDGLAVMRAAIGLAGELVCGDPTRLALLLADERLTGALRFQVDYSRMDGDISGSGEFVDCSTDLPQSNVVYSDLDNARVLNAGYIFAYGFAPEGRSEIGSCELSPTGIIDNSDFRVSVIEAVDDNGTPLESLPKVFAIPY